MLQVCVVHKRLKVEIYFGFGVDKHCLIMVLHTEKVRSLLNVDLRILFS